MVLYQLVFLCCVVCFLVFCWEVLLVPFTQKKRKCIINPPCIIPMCCIVLYVVSILSFFYSRKHVPGMRTTLLVFAALFAIAAGGDPVVATMQSNGVSESLFRLAAAARQHRPLGMVIEVRESMRTGNDVVTA